MQALSLKAKLNVFLCGKPLSESICVDTQCPDNSVLLMEDRDGGEIQAGAMLFQLIFYLL